MSPWDVSVCPCPAVWGLVLSPRCLPGAAQEDQHARHQQHRPWGLPGPLPSPGRAGTTRGLLRGAAGEAAREDVQVRLGGCPGAWEAGEALWPLGYLGLVEVSWGQRVNTCSGGAVSR